ncbi:MAG: hypothetical protein DSZ04_02655 [Sulfurimonas sp.]|nr:MAG: hypothetical protein DSZ04_02655 [Sulfurimonas sp.]
MGKRFSRAFALLLVPFVGSFIIRLLYYTNKIKFHSPDTITETSVIFACWHGELLMLPYFYKHYRKNPRVKALISPHFDGKLIAKTINFFGFDSLSGSSDKSPARVLIQAIKSLKEGYDIGITPDGPKGPRHNMADGIIIMAQKTSAKILLVEIKPTKYWKLNSWDKFVIPKPFGTIHYYSSSEIDVSTLSIEEARTLLQEGLLKHEK